LKNSKTHSVRHGIPTEHTQSHSKLAAK